MWFVTFLLKNLFRRKLRSALTGSAVAVAVGTLVGFLGVSDGFERSTVEAFEKRGVDLVVVAGGVIDQLSSDLDEHIGDRIQHIPGVRTATPGLIELVELHKGNSVIGVVVQGWRLDNPNFNDLEILSGRRLQADDRRGVMLGVNLAGGLNKQVGDTVEIQREDFQVVGIFRSFTVFENGGAVVLLSELQPLMARKNSVTGFSVVLDHDDGATADIDAVRSQIEALTDERGRPLGLSAQPTKDYASTSVHIRMAHAMAWLTSMIAVVIGSIGMLNTMIMSVFERTREIGILRAVGWRPWRVVRMILGEALLLSLAGAVLGTGAAVVLTRWLTTFPQVAGFVAGDIAPVVILEGFLMALLVALVGGAYPAYRAARLLPTEALRHE
jgi:putative ABC transport system permease protein